MSDVLTTEHEMSWKFLSFGFLQTNLTMSQRIQQNIWRMRDSNLCVDGCISRS